MKKTEFVFEEIPFNELNKVKGGGGIPRPRMGGGCKCSDACSCYTGEKDSQINRCTDSYEET